MRRRTYSTTVVPLHEIAKPASGGEALGASGRATPSRTVCTTVGAANTAPSSGDDLPSSNVEKRSRPTRQSTGHARAVVGGKQGSESADDSGTPSAATPQHVAELDLNSQGQATRSRPLRLRRAAAQPPLRKNKRMLEQRVTPRREVKRVRAGSTYSEFLTRSKRHVPAQSIEQPESKAVSIDRGVEKGGSRTPARSQKQHGLGQEPDAESLGSTTCSPASSVLQTARQTPAVQAPEASPHADLAADTRTESAVAHESPPARDYAWNPSSPGARKRKRVNRPITTAQRPTSTTPQAIQASQSPTPKSGDREMCLIKMARSARNEDVVWTKLKGHPYWPAQIIPMTPVLASEARFRAAAKFRRRLDDTCVQYFGTLELAWVEKAKACISWEKGVRKGLHKAMPKRAAYTDAINEVVLFCGRNKVYPRGWWSEPQYLSNAAALIDLALLYKQGPSSSSPSDVINQTKIEKMFASCRKESIMWGKLRGFPHWPVQIIPFEIASKRFPNLKLAALGRQSSASSSSVVSKESVSETVPCMFFGTGEVATLLRRNLTDFKDGVTQGYVQASERNDFHTALGEVYGYLQTPRQWPALIGNHSAWWNAPDGVVVNETHDIDEERTKMTPPRYEYIRKSVWPDRESPPPRTKRSEIPICGCAPAASGSCMDNSCLNFMSRIICDPGTCPAGESCRNVSFHRRRNAGLQCFRTTDGRGWGLRTLVPVGRGDFIIEYVGEIVDMVECEKRLRYVQRQPDAEYYMMEITADHVLDARHKGNLSRFINSSCQPNCTAQKWIDATTGQTRVGIFAMEDIVEGSELLYNYCFQDFGLASKRGNRAFTCRCGSSNCCMYEPGEYERTHAKVAVRIKVKWDEGWFAGVVKSYDPATKDFMIHYDDGDQERLPLGENSSSPEVEFKLLSSD